ncbi:MAG: hypothetical protein NUW01_18235 [Gemmatimonadaceae bacterium]|nr:hypothetical protein [Gemmatimonadaceae bacterium]
MTTPRNTTIYHVVMRPICWVVGHRWYGEGPFMSWKWDFCTRCWKKRLWGPESVYARIGRGDIRIEQYTFSRNPEKKA